MGLIELRPSLRKQAHALASPEAQLQLLDMVSSRPGFAQAVARAGAKLLADPPRVLQLNLGKRCNQTCRHCHVDAGPDRQEVMTDETLEASLRLLEHLPGASLDLTGGAPELHPRFREIVLRGRALGCQVMDRCNLTVLELPNYRDLPRFFADNRVEVVASLPAVTARSTDSQRGRGVFEQSLAALRRLNAEGFGQPGSGLTLTLVTNPVGALLPGPQAALERDWKRRMRELHGIEFNRLIAITNMPISRFLEFLVASGNLERYMETLVQAFNPGALAGLMCRYTLSVGWDGRLYDCDFNQMLGLEIGPRIVEATVQSLTGRPIRTRPHCFGCTAGAGSSCGGATA
jgi:radical SAM/Cys-rich protein